jgi:hypothetical protein
MLLGIVAGLLAIVALLYAGVSLLTPAPAAPSVALDMPRAAELDTRWGSYLAEREWGTPRESIDDNAWGLSWRGAISTPYRFGDDGIAGWSDDTDEFRLGWAFWDGTQDHVTERFNGLANMAGPAGEQITDDRLFRENSATHAYDRLTYNYPNPDKWFSIDLEAARYDSTSMTFAATVTNTTSDTRSVDVVFKSWTGDGERVSPIGNGLLMRGPTSFVAVVGQPPSEWQISADKSALDVNLRAGGLAGDQGGNIGALAYRLEIPAGADSVIRLGVAEATFDDVISQDAAQKKAIADATARLATSDAILSARQAEVDGTLANDVSQHGALYQQALMSMLWNETYYRWDGTSGAAGDYAGRVNAHDVLIVADKWEYPFPTAWQLAFDAVSASLVDEQLAQNQLLFVLSDRWQQPDGHIPCSEADMSDECPPIYAWAAWRVYEQSHDLEFLQQVYPGLQRNYDYWWSHNMVGNSLFGGGALGMGNLPRSSAPGAQADASGWMALFARDMARIASEVRDPAGSERYWVDRGTIQGSINTYLWDDQNGFYYDLGQDGSFVGGKSYSGLVPFIAGVVPPERLPHILAALRDPGQFLSPAGIRSLSASSVLYQPRTAGKGINANWRGPVWLPINYLLVDALSDVDPSLAEDIRDRVVTSVEADWRATARIHEFFDGDTGAGLGSDENAGWTARVANMIHDAWPAPASPESP